MVDPRLVILADDAGLQEQHGIEFGIRLGQEFLGGAFQQRKISARMHAHVYDIARFVLPGDILAKLLRRLAQFRLEARLLTGRL